MTSAPWPAHLSDEQLLAEVGRLAGREREATAELIASLAELDARRLYLGEGYPSLFAYCTQKLHLSEHAAYHRIEAARAVRRFPLVLERLREGALTLTAVGLLRAHLTEENHREVLDAARHQGKRAVEEVVARLCPRPDVRTSVRELPAPRARAADRTTGVPLALHIGAGAIATASQPLSTTETPAVPPAFGPTPVLPPRASIVRPLAPARYQVQMTVSAETHAKLRHAQDLLRHVIPNGDPAVVFDRALTLLIADLERTKWAAKKGNGSGRRLETQREAPASAAGEIGAAAGGDAHPRPAGRNARATTAAATETVCARSQTPTAARSATNATTGLTGSSGSSASLAGRSRHIPAAVRRAVWARDGGQCTFVGPAGRCPERGFLEFHHREPFAEGGETTVANVVLACTQHNQWEAERYFDAIAKITEPTRSGPS